MLLVETVVHPARPLPIVDDGAAIRVIVPRLLLGSPRAICPTFAEERAENYGVTGFMSNAPDQWL